MSKYPSPKVTVDVTLFSWQKSQIAILLIQRKKDPFKGTWALPGGFVEENEPVIKAAQRELKEETGLSIPTLAPLGSFDEPGRDPRGWTISIAFWGIVPNPKETKAGTDAKKAKWFPLTELPDLAFDHQKIIESAQKTIKIYASNARYLMEGVGQVSVNQLKALVENW